MLTSATSPSNSDTNSNNNTSSSSSSSSRNDDVGTAPAGAIAGGVVGGVAFLTIALVGLWFFRRKKHKEKERGTATTAGDGGDGDGGGGGTTNPASRSELTGYHPATNKEEARPVEIDGATPPVELSAIERPHELPVRYGSS